MPIHDWTRVDAGTFHHFHHGWTTRLSDALNRGLLPKGYFALSEQVAGGLIPDVLTLQRRDAGDSFDESGVVAVQSAPPKTRFVSRVEQEQYAAKANRIAIRHRLGHVVAMIEIVSPGNKGSRSAIRSFVSKSVEYLYQGVHLLVIDLFPPTSRDPDGIHKLIWDEVIEEEFELPADERLVLASYCAGPSKVAFVEPVGVGDVLPPMPIFLKGEQYVPAPLEATYMETWNACPDVVRELFD
jgi:hypothetical protein